MSTASKVLVGLVFLLALPSIFLVARALSARTSWNQALERGRTGVANLEKEVRVLYDGAQPGQGVGALRNELHKMLKQRGRVWYGATPAGADADTGAVAVTLPAPDPHGLEPPTVVYLFEEATAFAEEPVDRGRYLGQFRVDQAAAGQVSLVPSLNLSSTERNRLVESAGPWVVYEVMPADRYDVFDHLDPELVGFGIPADPFLERNLPLQDAAEGEFPPYRVKDGKLIWPLRDYGLLFRELNRQRVQIEDDIASIENTLTGLRAAQEDADKQIAYRQQEKAALTAELADMNRQVALVTEHRDAVAQDLKDVTARQAELLAEIDELSARIQAVAATSGP